MSRLIIDGYNLIGAITGRGLSGDIEAEREVLIERLVTYRRHKGGIKITLVFDGYSRPSSQGSSEVVRGVEVVFSGAGRTADSLIKELVRRFGSGVAVVSSDREIRSFVESCGGVSISSGEFAQRLEFAEYAELKGVEEDEEDEPAPGASGRGCRKRGPSRRAPRRERRRRHLLKKL